MNQNVILSIMLVLVGGLFDCCSAQSTGSGSLQQQLEQIAKTNDHFSVTTIIQNRPLRLWPPMLEVTTNGVKTFKMGTNALVAEQLRLVAALHSLSEDRAGLKALLTNSDPKVRTLALGAIFQREDGQDLPLIAALIEDAAKTFADLHESLSQAGGEHSMSEFESQQTVGDVAQAMLAYWGIPHEGGVVQPQWGGSRITANDFAEYWKKYTGRNYAASWFAVKMKRATRGITPIPPEYKMAIQRVLDEIEKLPMPARAWTELYVLAPDGWFEFEKDDLVVSDSALIEMIKPLGPDALLRFLQRESISDDLDLRLDKDDPKFVQLSNFILRHADLLLPAGDADALLACGYVQHDSGGIDPAWAIGAALVDPARAHDILQNAIAHETRKYEASAGLLAGALWRIRGSSEIAFLADWFYKTAGTEVAGQTASFLWTAQEAARSDTKELMAALVQNPRFAYTSWETLKEMLKIANARRATPLVHERDIYDAQPNGLLDDRIVLANWRNLLRREYGLPEEPPPKSEAKPKQVLTVPAWSVTVTNEVSQVSQMTRSPDGRLLALLINGAVTIWEANSGKFVWEIPNPIWAGSDAVAFSTNNSLILMEHDQHGLFTEWDLATHKKIRQVPLAGKPDSGVDEGAHAFDGNGVRFAFSGYNSVACFDCLTGKALWLDKREGGVRSVVAISADGNLLAAGGGYDNQNRVKVFDATNGNFLRQFDEHSGKVEAVAFSVDRQFLVTVTAEDGVRLWAVTSGKLLQSYSYPVKFIGAGTLACLPVFSSDGHWLAIAGSSTSSRPFRIGIFRVETGELQWELRHSSDDLCRPPVAIMFAPDGNTLYTCGDRLEAWPLK